MLYKNYLVAVLLTVLLTGCSLLYRDLEEPRVRLVSVAPQQLGFSGIKLLCQLRIENPNDVSIPVRGGQFSVDVEGMQIAKGALIEGFSVAASGSELVDVVVNVDPRRSIKLAARLLSGGEQEVDYALTGHIDVAIAMLGRVRINETGSVQLTGKSDSGQGSTRAL